MCSHVWKINKVPFLILEKQDRQKGELSDFHSLKLTQATTYYTPEQLSGYYDQLITAGYMTKEQAQTALDQVWI